ncbi:MAG: hypothetical protein A2Y17_11980 [Clostridiales bacterium GWF2_38_85]|nr:MAG: hypothetical protein A2Y17_11980 [Clostridiales bacterium GWF2_38_85]HBL85420.1 arginine repressor [Clostridiales bacterium]
MKTRRQELILKLIKEHPIDTQEELALLIKKSGIETTQATISRDLKELDIEKVVDRSGITRYGVVPRTQTGSSFKLAKILAETIQGVDFAGNLVVVKALVGMGNATGAAIDAMGWDDIVGSIAGDDTFLIITKNESKSMEICHRIEQLIK